MALWKCKSCGLDIIPNSKSTGTNIDLTLLDFDSLGAVGKCVSYPASWWQQLKDCDPIITPNIKM